MQTHQDTPCDAEAAEGTVRDRTHNSESLWNLSQQSLHVFDPEAGDQRAVNPAHGFLVQLGEANAEAGFVQRADLLQKDDRITAQAVGADGHMGRQLRFRRAARDGCDDGRRTVAVAGVILQHENRSDTALLAAHNRTQVGAVDFAAFDWLIHSYSLPIVSNGTGKWAYHPLVPC